MKPQVTADWYQSKHRSKRDKRNRRNEHEATENDKRKTRGHARENYMMIFLWLTQKTTLDLLMFIICSYLMKCENKLVIAEHSDRKYPWMFPSSFMILSCIMLTR